MYNALCIVICTDVTNGISSEVVEVLVENLSNHCKNTEVCK